MLTAGARVAVTPQERRHYEVSFRKWSKGRPIGSISQDVYDLARDYPTHATDTDEDERRAGSGRLSRFLGLLVHPETGTIALDREHPIEFDHKTSELIQGYARAVHASIQETYDNAPWDRTMWKYHITASAPHVATFAAKIGDPMRRALFSGDARVVFKAYDIGRMATAWEKPQSTKRKYLLSIVTGIMVGSALNELTSRYSTCITPHFARILDWAVLPRNIFPLGSIPVQNRDALPLQAVVEENAGDMDFHQILPTATLGNLVSIAYQLIHALGVAQLALGFCHNDFHVGNWRIKKLPPNGSVPYANAHLAYGMPNTPGFVVLPPSMHGNLFPRIIDFGSSRCFVPKEEEPELVGDEEHASKHTVLVGPEDGAYSQKRVERFGIARRNVNWSRDTQVLGHIYLCYVDFRDLERRPGFDRQLYGRLVSLVGLMVHTRYYVTRLRAVLKAATPASEKVIRAVPGSMVARVNYLWERFYSGYARGMDAFGSPILSEATLALNSLIHDGTGGGPELRNLLNEMLYSVFVSDKSACERQAYMSPNEGLHLVPTPVDCLALDEMWAPLMHTEAKGALPADTVLAGILKPSQVLRDPLRNDSTAADTDLPPSMARYLPRVPLVRREAPAINASAQRKSNSLPRALPLRGTTEPPSETSLPLGEPMEGENSGPLHSAHHHCVLCEMPAALAIADPQHASTSISVCSALCGQVHLMKLATAAKLSA